MTSNCKLAFLGIVLAIYSTYSYARDRARPFETGYIHSPLDLHPHCPSLIRRNALDRSCTGLVLFCHITTPLTILRMPELLEPQLRSSNLRDTCGGAPVACVFWQWCLFAWLRKPRFRTAASHRPTRKKKKIDVVVYMSNATDLYRGRDFNSQCFEVARVLGEFGKHSSGDNLRWNVGGGAGWKRAGSRLRALLSQNAARCPAGRLQVSGKIDYTTRNAQATRCVISNMSH